MIHTSPTLPLISSQYRHTSFLRGCGEEELDEKKVGQDSETTLYPLYSFPNRAWAEKERSSKEPSAENVSVRSSPYSTISDESSMTAAMSLASRTDATQTESELNGHQRPFTNKLRSPERKADLPFVHDRAVESREQGTIPSFVHGRDAEGTGARLPGIAHLDRQMPTPWNVGRPDGREESHARYSPSALREQSHRRFEAESDDRRRSSFAPPTRRPSNVDRFTAGFHAASDRLPSYRSMNKRSDSPSSYREYEQSGDERTFSDDRAYYDARRPDNRSTTWPSSPGLHREEDNGSQTQPRSSALHLERMTERSSLPPVKSRGEAFYNNHSPPARAHYEHSPRGLGLATDGATDGYNHHHYRPSAGGFNGLGRGSASSLRSLSTPYPYESVDHHPGAVPRSYHDQRAYDDGHASSRQMSVGGHHHHSPSPRHHPYAQTSGHSHGMPSTAYGGDAALAPGSHSPGSIPRRRGKLPKPVTDLLKTWLLDHAAHPYPTEDEKRRLCAATGLSISQVSNWFINARRRILVPQGSGHFGVAPSAVAISDAVGADEDGRPTSNASHQVLHTPSYPPPHSDLLASYPPHHHPYHPSHHQQPHPHSAYEHAQHLSNPAPPSALHSGLPLGPPPLPSNHHHYDTAPSRYAPSHGPGRSPYSSSKAASEHYSRSAEQSPILSRRRESP